MSAIAFDTHKFVRRLKESDMPEPQAEVLADAFKDAQGEAEFATKQDIADLRRDLKELGAKLTGNRRELDTKLSHDLRETEMRLTIKLGAMLVVAIGAVATLVKLL